MLRSIRVIVKALNVTLWTYAALARYLPTDCVLDKLNLCPHFQPLSPIGSIDPCCGCESDCIFKFDGETCRARWELGQLHLGAISVENASGRTLQHAILTRLSGYF